MWRRKRSKYETGHAPRLTSEAPKSWNLGNAARKKENTSSTDLQLLMTEITNKTSLLKHSFVLSVSNTRTCRKSTPFIIHWTEKNQQLHISLSINIMSKWPRSRSCKTAIRFFQQNLNLKGFPKMNRTNKSAVHTKKRTQKILTSCERPKSAPYLRLRNWKQDENV